MSKSTKILLGILIILAVIYAVQRLTSTMTTTEKSTPFSGLDTSKVNRVSIVTTKGIVIVKQEGRWLIISPIHYPADQGQVSIILSRIAANPSASVVADNMSDSSAYGLGPDSPTISIQQIDGRTVSFRLGAVTPDFNGCYVQFHGEMKILNLATNIRTIAGESLTDWRDKEIFSFSVNNIQSIDFIVGDTLYNFVHRDSVWQVNGTGIPLTEVHDLIGSLINTTAIDFIDTAVSVKNALLGYKMVLLNGERLEGSIVKLAEQTCISNSANNQTYVVSPMLPDNLKQKLKEIRQNYLARKRS